MTFLGNQALENTNDAVSTTYLASGTKYLAWTNTNSTAVEYARITDLTDDRIIFEYKR